MELILYVFTLARTAHIIHHLTTEKCYTKLQQCHFQLLTLPSNFMPNMIQRLKRQAGHFLRFARLTTHSPILWQTNVFLF